jgi:hypothetical protein
MCVCSEQPSVGFWSLYYPSFWVSASSSRWFTTLSLHGGLNLDFNEKQIVSYYTMSTRISLS